MMMTNYIRRVLDTKYGQWLEEEVYISKGHEYAPRKNVILWFIQELCDFIKSEGYVFRAPLKDIAQSWARALFRSQHDLMKWRKVGTNPEHTTEDYDMYDHIFDTQRREPFINKWLLTDDYTMNHASRSLLFSVFDFAWYYINIRASTATQMVDQMWEASESDEEGQKIRTTRNGRVNDAYLEDQANAVSKYNRWD